MMASLPCLLPGKRFLYFIKYKYYCFIFLLFCIFYYFVFFLFFLFLFLLQIVLEVNPTSNQFILELAPNEHPLPMYLRAKVPVSGLPLHAEVRV